MSCHPNSRSGNLALIILVIIFSLASSAMAVDSSGSDNFNETVRILERWTAAHWGQDCFVWVVHYPRDLIEPWVNAEAARSGMSETERENYRRKFIADLQLDDSDTFLVSVYSFGARPVHLSPVDENICLLTSNGTRVKPSRYDSSLEYASNGVVQGLVFFPKQSNKNFSIALKGMSSHERIFSFDPPEYVPPPKQEAPEVVVVNIPKKKQEPRKPAPPPPPPPPVIPARPITPIFQEDSRDMAEFVSSLKSRDNSSSSPESKPEPAKTSRVTRTQTDTDNSYVSRENVLRKFLELWVNNNSIEMYEMLSESSKRLISRENFAKEVSKASDFKSGLKGEYKIEWLGNERAKVTVERRMLMFRSLVTRTLTLTRESSAWKIIW